MERAEMERHRVLPHCPPLSPLFMASNCTLGISLSFPVLGVSASGNQSHLDIDRHRQNPIIAFKGGPEAGCGKTSHRNELS